MTKTDRATATTLFARNSLSLAGQGVGGEHYCSFLMDNPTDNGVTTPLTFTRKRRCLMIDNLRILGK